MHKIVCNIPHSSMSIPEWARKDILISEDELFAFVEFMIDKDIDRMWEFVPDENKEVATLSRVILNIERFRSDADEIMSAKGMGLYYTHTPEGKQFRIKSTNSYNRCLAIYDAYHKSLEEKVANCLEQHGECIILDCHSFHDEMHYTDYEATTFPDVCIGVNGEMSTEAQFIIDAFYKRGYSLKVNEPFSGSLVPVRYLGNNCVHSVMIKLNRRIYDNFSFCEVQSVCKEIFEQLDAR